MEFRVWPRARVQAMLSEKAIGAEVHTSRTRPCPERSILALLLIEEYPNPVHLEGTTEVDIMWSSVEGFQRRTRPTGWSPDHCQMEPQAKKSRQVPDV